MKLKLIIAAASFEVFSAFIASPLVAHHGYSRFDGSRPLYLEGVIREVYWGQPHVEITVRTEGRAPAPDFARHTVPEGGTIPRNLQPAQQGDWEIVASTIGRLGRRGLEEDVVAPGKRIVVVAYPSCDERNHARAELVVVESGETYWIRDAEAQTACQAPS